MRCDLWLTKKMPPELPHYRSLSTPLIRYSPPSSPEAPPVQPVSRKSLKGNKAMKIPGRKVIPMLVFILSTISVLRLLKIATTTKSSNPPLSALMQTHHACHSSSHCSNISSNVASLQNTNKSTNILTKKEFQLLSSLIKQKAPCNLLIFGLEAEYMKLSSINSGGITVILEDDPDKIRSIREITNSTRIYKVDYNVPAKEAYQQLKLARKNRACAPRSERIQNSTCELALTNLPEEIYRQKWDIVVVDGPSGNSPEAPGRMAVIYTAGIIARAGNTTNVLVHDVDRTIEKWFSWEFLCDENLVSSKGRLWNFRITSNPNSTRFCPDNTILLI